MRRCVAVLLYPGCIFHEIAAATDLLAAAFDLRWYTPDGLPHPASNGARLLADGDYAVLPSCRPAAVLVPGGNPDAIIDGHVATPALQAAAAAGAVMAGICAGGLVLARAGLLRGRRATHNYTSEWACADVVACTAPIWDGIVYERADLVVDGNFITAQHWADAAFAAQLALQLGAMDEAQARHYLARRRFSLSG